MLSRLEIIPFFLLPKVLNSVECLGLFFCHFYKKKQKHLRNRKVVHILQPIGLE
jgi:hypothetical protein